MSKGDWKRPRDSHVSEDDYGRNFEAIFGKKELKTWDLGKMLNKTDKIIDSMLIPVEGNAKWRPAPRADGRMEWTCIHGVGHGNHTHGCDGCCNRDDYPGRSITGHRFVPHPHHPHQLLCTKCHAIMGQNPERMIRGLHICEDPDNEQKECVQDQPESTGGSGREETSENARDGHGSPEDR